MKFLPDSRTLVTASGQGQTEFWDWTTGRRVRPVKCVGAETTAFSPDGELIAAAELNGVVAIWDVARGRRVHHFKAHSDMISALTFSPTGKTVVTVSYGDGVVKVWNAASGRELREMEQPEVLTAAFSPDGRVLATGGVGDGEAITLRSTSTWRILREMNSACVYALAFAPDGKLLASGEYKMPGLTLWSAATGRLIQNLDDAHESVETVAFSPDGMLLASAGLGEDVQVWRMPASEAR